MFDFFDMVGNHKDREVDHYEEDEVIIDTCSVTDSAQSYETGIVHPDYNREKWIIVEMYRTSEEAQKGHNKWVKVMTAKTLPDKLVDVSSASVAELRNMICGTEDNTFYRRKKTKK